MVYVEAHEMLWKLLILFPLLLPAPSNFQAANVVLHILSNN